MAVKKIKETLQKIGASFLVKEFSEAEALTFSQENYVLTAIVDRFKLLAIAKKTSVMNPVNPLAMINESDIMEAISHMITEKIKAFLK